MLVSRSTVDFRSCRRSLFDAGKLFCVGVSGRKGLKSSNQMGHLDRAVDEGTLDTYSVAGQINAQRIMKLVQEFDEFLFAKVGGRETVAGADGRRSGSVGIISVYIG